MTGVLDRFDARRSLAATGLLAPFTALGLLNSADVHVAMRLGAIAGEVDDAVLLAAALAVRAPRLGHVFVDLQRVASTASVESEEAVDLSGLPWPAPDGWVARVAASALTDEPAPLRLDGARLYLDRYWQEELQLAADLRAFSAQTAHGVDAELLTEGLGRLFAGPEGDGRQQLAAATALLRRLCVVAGGPGTGKTTTVARIVALLLEQAAGGPAPLIALAAPTGKAAARLEEAIHAQARTLDVGHDVRAALASCSASTLHRLLGWRPDSSSRFAHHRANRLPHDVVIVDETSMVSLSLMGRLVEAIRPDARLVLIGDPGQLTSIEAGAVLGDVVGPARDALILTSGARTALQHVTGRELTATQPPAGVTIGDAIVVLQHVHRFGGTIAALAEAVGAGDADTTVGLLRAQAPDVSWLDVDVAATPALDVVREEAVAAGRAVIAAAGSGDRVAALRALGAFRVLCAHRQGPYGAAHWMTSIERWLSASVPGFDPDSEWYVGRPLLITENDHGLKLYNGDTGVVVATGANRVAAAFERRGDVVEFSPGRLGAVDTVYAMTIHKSQGSQFDTTAVLLPGPDSPILTRELLYTALTRASQRLIVCGTEAAIRAAVRRPAARASALRERLWESP